jgi:phage terminase large subunit-like protein
MLVGGESVTRDELTTRWIQAREAQNEWLRRQVIDFNRVDILADEVLGYKLQPFHRLMLHFSMRHPISLQLAFRGAGKTTSVEIVRILHAILKDRDVRILIVSKTQGFATDILREIKQHLEENERFREIFGDLVGEDKWDQSEIIVTGRTKPMKESTITCVGIGGQLIGKHFDQVYGDDLVDEDNSRTEIGRKSTQTWYYKVMHPTMEPHCELHLFGTRYHFRDLYGHLQENELKEHTQIVPALDSKGRSPWPEKYPASFFRTKLDHLGLVIFNSQFQCDTEAMRGEIFDIDWMGAPCSLSDVPAKAKWFAGIDLAIKTEEHHDQFAMVGIATQGPDIWVTAMFAGHLNFGAQTAKIKEWWDNGMGGAVDKRRIVCFGIETNAYQDAQYQRLKTDRPDMVMKPIITMKDKVTRAHRLAARFQEGRVHICKSVYNALVDHLLQFPGGRYKDIFDALDLAISTAFKRQRKRRSEELGLM